MIAWLKSLFKKKEVRKEKLSLYKLSLYPMYPFSSLPHEVNFAVSKEIVNDGPDMICFYHAGDGLIELNKGESFRFEFIASVYTKGRSDIRIVEAEKKWHVQR